jgi:serine/threonine-protein kinase
MQVADSGGQPTPLTTLDEDKGERTHRWPQWLPGGRALLFTSHTKQNDFDEASIEVLVPATGERRVVHRGGTYGRYVAASEDSGFVIYAHAGSLFAIPFNLEQLEATGSAAPVVQGVTSGSTEGSAQYSTSHDGKLAYSSGKSGRVGHTVVWVDREGKIEPLLEEEQFYRNPAFSPDGTRLAMDILAEGQGDIWIYDIQRDVQTRLTFSDGDDVEPIWSPDGEYIYYTAEVEGRDGIHRKLSDGSGDPETLFLADGDVSPTSISPDGKTLAFNQQIRAGNWDIGLLRVDQEAEPEMLVTSPALEASAMFSPDGRWLAYISNESGTFEVYVRPLEGRGKWQISSQGGSWPEWSADGKELFFWAEPSTLFVVDVDAGGSTFKAGRARILVEGSFADPGIADRFAFTPDGQRFVAFGSQRTASGESHEHLKLVLNWFDELRATFGD